MDRWLNKVTCGDSIQILREIDVDVIITDPVWPNCPPGLLPGSENPYKVFAGFAEAIKHMDRLKRIVIVLRYDSDPQILAPISRGRWPFFRVQVLPYVMPGFNGRKLSGLEVAYSFGTPIPSAPSKRVIPGMSPKCQPSRVAGHPCARSLSHSNWLVKYWTSADEICCDPFCGSGTYPIAFANAGRDFVAIDISPEYCRIAEERLRLETQQMSMFVKSASRSS